MMAWSLRVTGEMSTDFIIGSISFSFMNKGKAKGKNDAYKKFSYPLVKVKLLKIKILYNLDFFF